ncbi:MAG: GIY-YIG nuclease family protein [Bacteroidetes bacterium]|nr:GIY-YIG nuclease family protein [Bacteroidota bacterium]
MYAIVDIETTGSFASQNGITEIAIILFNGHKVEERFTSLVQPGCPIPKFVSHLTGITQEMVAGAPLFSEIAWKVFQLLNNRIFIAHNVNFDYSFIKYHLQESGFDWNAKKLCTLKLSREVFPGLQKYGLGSLCRSLDIQIENRHRAGGDADATCILFDKILRKGGEKIIQQYFKKENRAQILPPNLPAGHLNQLPASPGVYYFHNEKEKIIYTGKAKSLKSRVVGHFTGFNTSKKRQDFLRKIYAVSFTECATELAASILECIDIKKNWPEYNISQKNAELQYGIYSFEDMKGYMRLAINKVNKSLQAHSTFSLLTDAYRALWKLVHTYDLSAQLCFLDKTPFDHKNLETRETYNQKVIQAIEDMQNNQDDFLILEKPVFGKGVFCIYVENNQFYGMGLLENQFDLNNRELIKEKLTRHSHFSAVMSLIKSHALKYPEHVFYLKKLNEAI